MLIGCTRLPAMRRSEASPEAVTRSKPPSFISATISSEVAAVLTLTLQPVACLELGDPVEILVGLAALDVAGPGDDVDLALAGADLLDLGDRLAGEADGERNCGAGFQE